MIPAINAKHSSRMSIPTQPWVVARARGQRTWQTPSSSQGSRRKRSFGTVATCVLRMQKRMTPMSNSRVNPNITNRTRRFIVYSAVAASSFLRKENITTPEMMQRAIRTLQLTHSGTLSQSIDGMELR